MSDNFIYVLGTAQDGGYPHIGCIDKCCKKVKNKRYISSIAIVDNKNKYSWIIDVTPDISSQLRLLNKYVDNYNYPSISGIFLTHAHTGHYAGLINFGLECMNLKGIPIYVFSKMNNFLNSNSMFKQLIKNKNIIINNIDENSTIQLNQKINIKGFLVPHRNELSETVGFNIKTNKQSIIYLPDIDAWDQWSINILDLIKKHDVLLLDGTFYKKNELKNRDIKKVPHPTILQNIQIMNKLAVKERNKIYFTHLNHTNKALIKDSIEYNKIITSGYNILEDKTIFKL